VILSEVGSDLPCDAQTVYSAGTFHESLLLLQQGDWFESNAVFFHTNPPSPPPQPPRAFWSGVGSRWSRAQVLFVPTFRGDSCSRPSVLTISKPHLVSKLKWTLAK
jgi:hypothetical protein